MKNHTIKVSLFFLLLSLFAVSCSSVETTILNTDQERPLVEKAIHNSIGWAKNKDLSLLYDIIWNDDNYLEVDPDNTVIKGFGEFKKNEAFWMNSNFKAVRYEIKDLKISFSKNGYTAWWYCMLDDINEWKGKPASWLNTRWTGVLEKIDGKWKIVQMHFSFASDK